jgi:solute carrier family 25 (mitochondrial folate transporter), member 32
MDARIHQVPLYDHFKWNLSLIFPEQQSSIIHMGSAVTAGAISDVLCNPMFVVRTRLQTESLHHAVTTSNSAATRPMQNTIVETMYQLHAEGGICAFWRGMSANLLGLSHVAVQFPVYEHLKFLLRSDKQEGHETTAELLAASGLSKMSASLLTYPHEVIRSRMMDIRTKQRVGFLATCSRLYSTEGVVGFYAGLPVSLIRVIPNTMLTFLVYERSLHFFRVKSN